MQLLFYDVATDASATIYSQSTTCEYVRPLIHNKYPAHWEPSRIALPFASWRPLHIQTQACFIGFNNQGTWQVDMYRTCRHEKRHTKDVLQRSGKKGERLKKRPTACKRECPCNYTCQTTFRSSICYCLATLHGSEGWQARKSLQGIP